MSQIFIRTKTENLFNVLEKRRRSPSTLPIYRFKSNKATSSNSIVLWASSTGSNDITLCFISSQNLNNIRKEEFLIFDSDDEFPETGLKCTSKVIVSRIVTIDRILITRHFGNLGVNQLQQLNELIIETFNLL
jgi:mRNA interferase MazF